MYITLICETFLQKMITCHRGLDLSAVGFGIYLQRQVREAWGNAGGSWHIVVLVAYLSSFGHAPWQRHGLDVMGVPQASWMVYIGKSFED